MIGTIYRIETGYAVYTGRVQGSGGMLGGAGPVKTPKQARAGLDTLENWATKRRTITIYPRLTWEGDGEAIEVTLDWKCQFGIIDFDTDEPITLGTPRETVKLAWRFRPRVKVQDLKRGEIFFSSEGDAWRYVRKDGALSGAHHVETLGRLHEGTTFAGCAEVLKLTGRRP